MTWIVGYVNIMINGFTVENIVTEKHPMQTFRNAKYLAAEKTVPVAELSDSDTNQTITV